VTTWLNTSPMQIRTIDGLSIRFAESEERGDLPGFGHSQRHDALLSPRAWVDASYGADEYAALVTTWRAGGYATAGSAAAR
jgi:hypothetical protein